MLGIGEGQLRVTTDAKPRRPPQHLSLVVVLRREDRRAKCGSCGRRRVLFSLNVQDSDGYPLLTSPRVALRCAECAGVRP